MRINRFLAQVTSLSRRAADQAIAQGMVRVNSQLPSAGHEIQPNDQVTYAGKTYRLADIAGQQPTTIILNKPRGYVVSRNGQGSHTVYDLLDQKYRSLQPVGRLDKDSSGLLVLTDDGELANQLTHPRYQKVKVYQVSLDKPLEPLHHQMISDFGISLEDGPSKLHLERLHDNGHDWRVTMSEGRNRQIRRTFEALGYTVRTLHRTDFGAYTLGNLKSGAYQLVNIA